MREWEIFLLIPAGGILAPRLTGSTNFSKLTKPKHKQVDLYVGKEMVKKGIPNEEATDALVELIKEHGRWVEPSESAEAPAAEKEKANA